MRLRAWVVCFCVELQAQQKRATHGVTISTFQKYRDESKPISMLTVCDYSTAKLMDEAGIDGALVGDSLGVTMLGCENTLVVTMDDALHHIKPVVRGAKHALVWLITITKLVKLCAMKGTGEIRLRSNRSGSFFL